MNPEWREFLTGAGAEFDDGRVVTFGNPEREKRVATTGTIICDLSHWGLVCVQGEDARTFLQGQFSNDLHEVSPTRSQLNAYLSPKGRMLASFRVFQRDERFYVPLPRSLVETFVKRLRMFVLRSKVSVDDASEALLRIGCAGPDAERELRDAVGAAPAQVNDVVEIDGFTILRLPGPHPRYEIYGELGPVRSLWERLNVHAAPVGAAPWSLLDILAGVPTIHEQNMEAFVPQMANLELVGGVSFKKGCYPGQEVVARTQYLGKPKRRMYRVHLEQDGAPLPGTEIYDPADPSGQSVGRIVDAQPHPDGGSDALAVIQIESAARGGLRLGSTDGPALSMRELPYEIKTAG
jgi:folate-binding protein YgfZ